TDTDTHTLLHTYTQFYTHTHRGRHIHTHTGRHIHTHTHTHQHTLCSLSSWCLFERRDCSVFPFPFHLHTGITVSVSGNKPPQAAFGQGGALGLTFNLDVCAKLPHKSQP